MIHFFIGTKAQLIKVAPIMRVLQDRGIDYNFILSGQHRDTMEEILSNFQLKKKPDIVLYGGEDITGVPQMGQWLLGVLRRYGNPEQLSKMFRGDANGVVINHGDTISTLLGSYLARKQGLKSAHVESGLRSHNLLHPFPEEITRLLTFRLSDYFFAPGALAMKNLESYSGTKIDTVHNTLYDALRHTRDQTIEATQEPYAIVSIHRFENIFSRKRLAFIVTCLLDANDGIKKRFILHNPTRKKLLEYGLHERLVTSPQVELHPRYDYFRFVAQLRQAEYLISDGGSNQEESYYLGLPCLLMRKATERHEGLGENVVLGKYDSGIIREFLQNYRELKRPALMLDTSPAAVIVDTLLHAGLAN